MQRVDERAREFARVAHRDQVYGQGSFFELHLTRVVATLERFDESDPVLLAAGWLHDVVEDTSTSVDSVRQEFGDEIADLVARLTDERDGTRRERQQKTHARIRERTGAVRVKLADRIANVESNIEMNSPLVDRMYRKEYSRFRDQLYKAGEYEEMWSYLDGLLKMPASSK
jgi:(p)ppGpp synthase/HD superfamily hydrolase